MTGDIDFDETGRAHFTAAAWWSMPRGRTRSGEQSALRI